MISFTKPQVTGQPETKTIKRIPHIFNAQGYGKAGNNAIEILISNGYFKNTAIEQFDLETYKELTKRIYKADIENIEELKGELQ